MSERLATRLLATALSYSMKKFAPLDDAFSEVEGQTLQQKREKVKAKIGFKKRKA